ncbi:ABC transporter permease [Hydrogenobacter hydrogenophilus]|uniref:Transport permease protein n=1 Tax=Hydrogenobacter hydrogenophilus TaxID=35835 RepID=A0A285NWU5_9AQUI|nr:ABC transporter permease [Hydrogenobacter hydrogenophilus]SNZ13964.1 lipopolysaccharide transport system permease protein [Hydrogenobacter hydrogenophilus]
MHNYYLLYQLVKRDIKMSFAGSMFGTLWMFLNPLLMTGIFYLIFQHIVRARFPIDATEGASYTVYLLTGLAFWNGFSQSLIRGMNSITDNAYLLKKTAVPPYLFVLASTITGFIYTFVSLGYALLLKDFPQSLTHLIPLIPVLMVELCFVAGLTLILGSLCVYVRDISQIVSTLLSFVFYSLPIIYPVSYVPEPLKPFLLFNPLFYMLRNVQTSLLKGYIDLKLFIISLIISCVSLVLGALVYKLLKRGFYDVL